MLPLRLLLSLILIDRCWSLYEIDWNQCFAGSSRLCYVEGNCVPSVAKSSRVIEQLIDFNNLINNHPIDSFRKACNIGIQTRTYSDSKLLMILQVLDQGKLSGDTAELALYQGEELLAGCKRTRKRFDILGQDKSRSLALYKDATHFNDNHMICAFTIYRPTEFTKLAKQQLVTNLRFSMGKGSTPSTIPLYAKGKFVFQMSQSVTCNPDDIIMQRSIEDHHVVPIKDINRDVLDCTNQDTSLGYTLMYTDVNSTSTEIKSVSCFPLNESAVNLEYAWQIIFKTKMTPLAIDDLQQFAFACATEISKMCGNPLECSGSDCPVFNNGTESSDAQISCPDGKWIIDGEYYEEVQPVCKAEMTKMNTAKFYINLGESEVDFTSGKCFKNYDCNKKSRLDYSNCDEKDKGCALLERDNATITCQKERKVIVQVRQANKTMSASKFICEKSTGQWKDEKGEAIPEFSLVMCEVAPKVAEQPMDNRLLIAIPVAVAIVMIPTLTLLGFCIFKRCFHEKQKMKFDSFISARKWKKMKPEKRVEAAKKIFESVCVGDRTIATAEQGLELIEIMLHTETEEPEVWESAQQFLWLLRGTAQLLDHAIYEKIGRFLYLEAKRIIDKYGWLSEQPVTNDNHKGYIITVAVQLLGNAMYASTGNEHAEDLIVEGFRQLRFAGESAYPQCGVLWSLITQIPIPYSRKQLTPDSTSTTEQQNLDEMNKQFFKLVEDKNFCMMPENEWIPQHGSVRQQAFVAIATSAALNHLTENKSAYFKHKKRKWFMDGLCNNLFYRNPAALPISSWLIGMTNADYKIGKENPGFSKFKKNVSREDLEEFFQKMEKAQAYNARMLDARLLEQIISFPKKFRGSEVYRKLRFEVNQFQCSMEENASEISAWLTKAISKLEKRKPVKPLPRVERRLTQLINDDRSGLPLITKDVGYVMDKTAVRATESIASPGMQEKCSKLIDALFTKRIFCGDLYNFDPRVMVDIVQEVRRVLEKEPALIEDVPADTYVVADVHAQFHDLYRYLTSVNSPDEIPGYLGGRRFVFMGDYVDRGTQALEVVISLFCLKILYPDKFILLRGNHENIDINAVYGFLDVCLRRYGPFVGESLYLQINATFSLLSFGAIVGGKVFCTHGGPPSRPVNKNFYRMVSKPVAESDIHDALHDMVWADPAIGLKGTCYNKVRHCSIYYSEGQLDFFLKSMGCTVMVRGHQLMTDGYSLTWNRLLTIFSCASEHPKDPSPNEATILYINEAVECQVLLSPRNDLRNEFRSTCAQDAGDDFEKDEPTVDDDGPGHVATVYG